jgi:acid phosphatase
VVEENTNGEAQPPAPGSVRVAARCVRTVVAALLAAATAGAVASCGGGAPTLSLPLAGGPPTPTSGVPTPAHTVVLVLENKDNSQILGSPSAPYFNALVGRAALFTNSHAVAHPSEPNYLALFAGDTFGLTSDYCPLTLAGPNLAGLLAAGGHSFAGFSEDLPAPGFTGCTSTGYARKHDPWANFPDLLADVAQPFTAFGPDYTRLPTVSFVIPNLCHDMHDCDVATGDTWLRDHLDTYLRWIQAHNSLLIITWDEDDAGSTDNHIATIFTGPMVKPGHYDQRIDHYSVLRTIEDAYRLPHAGHSQTATPITDMWQPS